MKRYAALAGAGALLLSMAGPALGWGGHHRSKDELKIANLAVVVNKTETEAETGENMVMGKGLIMTGNAGATAYVGNDVNYNAVAGCGCYDEVKIFNGALVWNDTETEAETGENMVMGGRKTRRHHRSGGTIITGNAGATSVVENFVNWNMVGGGL
jgi:hypothetical protein